MTRLVFALLISVLGAFTACTSTAIEAQRPEEAPAEEASTAPSSAAEAPQYSHRKIQMKPQVVPVDAETKMTRYHHKRISMKYVPWKPKAAEPAAD